MRLECLNFEWEKVTKIKTVSLHDKHMFFQISNFFQKHVIIEIRVSFTST